MLPLRFLFMMMLMSTTVFAQPKKDSAALNQTDNKGRRTGMWYEQVPEQMGEDAYAAFGNYAAGNRAGKWYKFNKDGDLLAEENYRYGLLDGEVKYFEAGRLAITGHYLGLNPSQLLDTIIVVDPGTGAEMLRSVSSTRGSLRHGPWRYYDLQTGRLIREDEYQVDELIRHKDFGMTPADSTYYRQRLEAMPHSRGIYYRPPPGKRSQTRF